MATRVYVSYAWGPEKDADSDKKVVERLGHALQGAGFDWRRDTDQIKYGASIRAFMREIGAADHIVVVLSDAYLRSPNCLFELGEIAKNGDVHKRVHPIILRGTPLHDPLVWVDYLEHWEQKADELEAKLGKIKQIYTAPLREKLDYYHDFRSMLAKHLDLFADMNTLTQGVHLETSFAALIERIQPGHTTPAPAPAAPLPTALHKPEPVPPPAAKIVTTVERTRILPVSDERNMVLSEHTGRDNRTYWTANEPIAGWQNPVLYEDQFGLHAEFTVKGVTQRCRWIAPGHFRMGSPKTEPERFENEGPLHDVALSGYWLADTACTQALWQAVTGQNPSKFRYDSNYPVEMVSWDDTREFFMQLNKLAPGLGAGLPSEAQWEYACRSGTTTPFSFGVNIRLGQVNHNGHFPYSGGSGGKKGQCREETVRVSSLPPNAWGLYEMHGNVWEWCADWYGHYPANPQTDPTGPAGGEHRLLRGGSWFHNGRGVRSGSRYGLSPCLRSSIIGLRVAPGRARSAEPTSSRR